MCEILPAVAATVLFGAGAIALLTTRERNVLPLTSAAARGLLRAYSFFLAGAVLSGVAMWISPGGWILKVIASIIVLGLIVLVVISGMRKMARRGRSTNEYTEEG